MDRRGFLASLLAATRAFADGPASLRGRLNVGESPSLTPQGGQPVSQPVSLSGDDATMGVLRDDRLGGADFEALGRMTSPGHFDISKIHTRSLFVHKDGKRLMVTYWCDVCYIRTYTPGKCWCCQKDTDLDLRESVTD